MNIKIIGILFLFYLPLGSAYSQVTHAFMANVGITNAYYRSEIPKSQSFGSFFLPVTGLDWAKHGQNTFWGGAGIGFHLRQIPFYLYSSGQKSGVNVGELWARARVGMQFEGSYLSHMPFVSLGISHYATQDYFTKYGVSGISYPMMNDSFRTKKQLLPFIEIGSKLINTDYREVKRSVSFTFLIRYYPIALFREPVSFEYDFGQTIQVQYKLIEFSIVAALQRNVHKD
jgi:hypothetical protein